MHYAYSVYIILYDTKEPAVLEALNPPSYPRYRKAATRGSLLYFVIADLSNI